MLLRGVCVRHEEAHPLGMQAKRGLLAPSSASALKIASVER